MIKSTDGLEIFNPMTLQLVIERDRKWNMQIHYQEYMKESLARKKKEKITEVHER